MKLLLFSDVHCDESKCRVLVEQSQKADLAICAGDIGIVRKGLENTIGILKAIRIPTLLVPGNSESYTELKDACRPWQQARVLHGKGIRLQGKAFFGVGGGIPITPFGDWSWDFSETEAEGLLAACPSNGILITHSPPQGVLDIASSGKHLGSRTIRETILTKKPRLVVCGHIHESSGRQSLLGDSIVINAGPRGKMITI